MMVMIIILGNALMRHGLTYQIQICRLFRTVNYPANLRKKTKSSWALLAIELNWYI